MTLTNTLSQRVFATVCDHFKGRASDLHDIAYAGYSFEEWFNWETFLACRRSQFESVHPRPGYRVCGATECGQFGDLLVEDDGGRVLVEVGVIHDCTQDKWLDKLDRDRAKLMQLLAPDVTTLQLIVCVSLGDISSDSEWQ